MTTPQNPYGPQAQPAQPYFPSPQTGPQSAVPRHAAPAPQASWNAAPRGGHQARISNGYPQHGGQPAGYSPRANAAAPQGHAAAPRANSVAPQGYTAAPQGNSAPRANTSAPQADGAAPQSYASAPAGYPQPGADRAWQGNAAAGVPAQRSGEYGAPQYPSGPQLQQPRNGFGVTALVLGILAVLFAMIPIIGMIAWPLAILGLIFGLLGTARARSGKANNQGVAISGTVLSAIGLILCIVWVAAVGSAVSSTTPPATGSLPASTGTGSTQAGGAFPGATSDDVVGNAGDTLTVGDMEITATALKPGDSTLGKTLCSAVTYKNTGSTPSQFSGIGDWKLQDPSGAALMTGLTGSTSMLSTGDLAPGGTTTGDVCFDRNASASGQYVLTFKPMLSFSSTRGAWLNQVG